MPTLNINPTPCHTFEILQRQISHPVRIANKIQNSYEMKWKFPYLNLIITVIKKCRLTLKCCCGVRKGSPLLEVLVTKANTYMWGTVSRRKAD